MRITAAEAARRLSNDKSVGGVMKAPSAPLTLVKKVQHGKTDMLYIFERAGKHIVTPADDAVRPVLAEFSAKKYNPELSYVLKEYSEEVACMPEDEQHANTQADGGTTITPLLGNIAWSQKAPWWNNLKFPNPDKAGKVYCYTGCVATAMAQVLFYWAKKGVRRGCRSTAAYNTRTYKYDVKAHEHMPMFDWNIMADTAPTTTKGKKAVAKLMEYVGSTVRMDYSFKGSGAPMANVAPALRDYFALGAAKRVQASAYTKAAFKKLIISELQKGNPVIMCGESSASGCHAFVCDGYDSERDLFHMNWGWGGDGNGWFAMTALSPNGKNFSTKKNAIINLDPHLLGDVNGDGKINMSDVTKVINDANSGKYDINDDVNFDGKVDFEDANKIIDIILGR